MSEPELFMEYTGADVGVIGEGELAVSELLRVFPVTTVNDLANIDGIIYRDHAGKIIRTTDRKLCKDLDEYPWPDLEGFDYGHTINEFQNISDFSVFTASVLERPRMIPLITSRACPFTCTFCFHTSGRRYSERALDDVFAEIEYRIEKYKANFIVILDEVFSPDAVRTTEFCERIKPYGVKWWCQSHVNMSNSNRLAMMREAGCVGLSYGIESMNDIVLKSMKKQNKSEVVAHTLQQSYESRLDMQGNLIFGDRLETLETAEETLTFWENNLHLGINLTMIALYPRSEMYETAVSNGIIKNPLGFIKAGCPIVNASSMSDDEFTALRVRVDICGLIRLYSRITEYSLEHKRDNVHGKLCRLKAVCPHCGASAEYRIVALPCTSNTTFFLACRECYRRFAPPLFKRSTRAQKYDKQANYVRGLLDAGDIDKAERISLRNLHLFPFHAGGLYEFSKIMQARGNRARAFSTAHLASLYDPARPEYLEQLADTAPDGFVGRVRNVLRKHAAWLRGQGIIGVTYVSD
ncbi:MAG: radical SAM protein [Desulfuromonadales bacterium]